MSATPPRRPSTIALHHSPPSAAPSPSAKRVHHTQVTKPFANTANHTMSAPHLDSPSTVPTNPLDTASVPSTPGVFPVAIGTPIQSPSAQDSGASRLQNLPMTVDATQTASMHAKMDPLQVKLLGSKGKVPTRGSEGAAGYDLYCSKTTKIPAHGRALVPTDISIAVPVGTYGRVAPRSGLAVKHGLQTGAGVIDADYRGPVGVVLFNHSDVDFEMQEGDRCAQLVLERIVNPDVVVVQELGDTVRGGGGFGSTGGFGKAG